MNFEKYKAFFFDFDGVIADSIDVKTQAFGNLFEEYGPEIREKVVDYHKKNGGVNRKDKFIYYYEELLGQPMTPEIMEDLCDRFSKLVVDNVVAASEIEGAEAFIKKWSQNVPCFIVSATPLDELMEIVECRNLKQYFQEVCGAPMKKDEIVRYLLEKYHLNSTEVIFFGDASSDYLAAQKHSVDFLAIVPDENAPLVQKYPNVIWGKNFRGLY